MGTRALRPQGLTIAVLLAAFVIGMLCVPILAGAGNNPNVKIAIHTKAHPTSCTKGYPTFTTCGGINTTWAALADFDAMPVFYDLAEVTVTELGLTWPAEWGTMSWVRCKGTIAVGGIQYPGEGTAISFATCQYSWAIAPGYGWLIATSPGTVTPIPYFATGDYGVVDCQPSPGPYYNYPVSTSYAGIGGTLGQDPCVVPIVAPTLSMVDNIGSTSCAFRADSVIYTLKYKNTNASGITGVTLIDSLPPYVTFVSATGGGSFASGKVTWSIGAMAAGDSGAVNLIVTVNADAPYGGVLVNNARISCTETTLISTANVSTHVCACAIDGPTQVCPLTTTAFCAPSGTGFLYAWSVTGSGSISGSSTGRCINVVTGSTCNTTYTVNLTITDGQGVVSQCYQEVAVNDTQPPAITSYPQDVAVQCLADVPAVNTRDVRGTDNCGTPTASHAGDDTTGTPCNWVINRTYRLTDACNNFDQRVQHITVRDTIPPVITFCPADDTVQCFTDVPAADIGLVTATDNCGGTINITHQSDQVTGTACNGSVVRTYRATDACSNVMECTQTFTILDTTDPYFTSACPADTTVECDDVPTAPAMAAADLCDDSVSVTYGQQRTDGRCANVYTLVRTWTATDDCGNDVQCVQTIAVVDTTPPVLVSGPTDTPLQCLTNLPAPNTALITATDNCGTPIVTWEQDDTTGTACSGTVDRTYRVADPCGNYIFAYHHFTISDTTRPQFVGTLPGDATVECNAVPTAPTLTATDNCDTSVGVDYAQQRTDGTCPHSYTLVRTWTATDDCGNTRQHVQTLTVRDGTPPGFTSHPSDVAVQCAADIPVPNPAFCTATDNCGTVTITFFSDVSDGNTCPEVITRTYKATDQCNNSSYEVQLITVDDTEAPTLLCRSDKRVACGAPIVFDNPDVSDACDPSPVLNVVADSSHVDPGTGEVVHTRCWTATDDCGNTSSQCCQNITEAACGCVVTGVDRTCPGASNQFCGPEGFATYHWTISGDGFIATLDNERCVGVVAGDGCDTSFVVRLEATTSGGGVSNCQKVVRVVDDGRPTFTSVPTTINVQCRSGVPAPAPSDLTATDACSAVTITWVGDTSNGGACPEIITRTYRATDACGNFADTTHYIRVHDTTPPVITCPIDVTRECSNIGDTGVATASDNCDTTIAISHTDNIVPGGGTGCYTIERTWTAADDCNNRSNCLQRITIVDTATPAIECAPNDTIGCTDLLVFTEPTATDLCAGIIVPTVVSTDTVSVPGTGEIEYTRCWQASDGCGNAARCCQTITREACPFVPLVLTKDDNVAQCVDPTGIFTYTLAYRNPNPGAVTAVTLVDFLSDDVTLLNAYDGVYSPDPPRRVTWILGTLAGGETGQKMIEVAINAGVPYGSQVSNNASLDCAETEPTTATLLTDVCEYTYLPLTLIKNDNIVDPVSPGDTIKYEILCHNDNDLPVDNVTIRDVLPDGVSLAWATSPYTYDGVSREVEWPIGTLAPHADVTVELWVTVDQGAMSGDIVNTARVVSDQTPTETTASHTTRIEGGEVMVYFDVKPGSCPNPINPTAKGVLPAAVLGTERFDVATIDPASLRLTRAGVTGSVAPLRWSYGDMATPATGGLCECNELGPDGYRDLGLKFSLVDVVSTLNLAGAAGRTVELTIAGMLRDGTPFRGTDCVRILGNSDTGNGTSLMQPSDLRFQVGDQVGVPDGVQVDLSFYLGASGRVTMDIFDIHGRLVASLLDSEMAAGGHVVTWNMTTGSGQRVPAGIYFVRASTAAQSITKKLVVVE